MRLGWISYEFRGYLKYRMDCKRSQALNEGYDEFSTTSGHERRIGSIAYKERRWLKDGMG